jgi:nickel/cobalt transporter (NicO) family protein
MTHSFLLLSLTAISIAFLHTVIGPDHYVPFIMMAKVQQWSRRRTLLVTLLCGIGHVLSSIILGVTGIAFGLALHKLKYIESVRGDIAVWALIAFGIIYGLWGLKAAFRETSHSHVHHHEGGILHEHQHSHILRRSHAHTASAHKVMTTWTLFTIFVLGPCEPLIPLLMLPAAAESAYGIIVIASLFSIVTIGTMLSMVFLLLSGIERLPLQTVARFTHALAGAIIAVTGIAIRFLGL